MKVYKIRATYLKYTHLNAEFQRLVRRDKKAFLSDQCKETEGNTRIGKTNLEDPAGLDLSRRVSILGCQI